MKIISNFTTKIKSQLFVSDNGGALTNDAGLVLFDRYAQNLHLPETLSTFLVEKRRPHVRHSLAEIAMQVIYQLIAGYCEDSSADALKKNRLFPELLGKKLASQPTLSRFFNHADDKTLAALDKVNHKLAKQYYRKNRPEQLVLDIDSTHFDTFGKQERADYNTHYGVMGYQPLLAYDAATGLCLGSELRNGSQYSSNNVEIFLRPILLWLKQIGITNILVRGDSGFATPKLYELCEELSVDYIIRLKKNPRLNRYGAEDRLVYGIDDDVTQREERLTEHFYQAGSWSHPRRVVSCQVRQAGEMIYSDEIYIVTSLTADALSSSEVLATYRQRGNMENFIKEGKLGFYMDKTDSSRFTANATRMKLSLLAYQLVLLAKLMFMSKALKNCTISTLRTKLIKIAARISYHSRRCVIHLDSTFVYLKLFQENLELLE